MGEHLHHESVYFEELHKEQECYIQSGGAVGSTITTDKIDYKLEKRNLINEHELNREPVPLIVEYW